MRIRLSKFILLFTITFQGQVKTTDSIFSIASKDFVSENLYVRGKLAIGGSVVDGMSLPIDDTFVLKENNLRIYFNDNSDSFGPTFPGNDWRFIFNDSSFNGENYFIIQDATNHTFPFRINAGAMTNSLFIGANGSVGLGTASPNTYASLDLADTNKALVLNRLTTADRNAVSASKGMLVYDVDDDLIYYYNGLTWISPSKQIDDLTSRIETIEACACSGTLKITKENNKLIGVWLDQNIPNPVDSTSRINYFIPSKYASAAMVISSITGQVLYNYTVTDFGVESTFNLDTSNLQPGTYIYTLYVEGTKAGSKKFTIN